MFQRCFLNVETTSINICRLNFHFQPNSNVEATLVHRRWIDVILSTLFCQRWNNVDKCTSAQFSFSTKCRRWNNVDERWRSTLLLRWFNFDMFAGQRCANCLKNELHVHLIHSRAGIICLLKCYCECKTFCEITKGEYFGKSAYSNLIRNITILVLFYALFSSFFHFFSRRLTTFKYMSINFEIFYNPFLE